MAIGTATALLGSAVIGGVASGLSAKSSNKAIGQATDAQVAAQRESNALQAAIYERNNTNLQPFIGRGYSAGTAINGLLGLGSTADTEYGRNAFQQYLAGSDYAFQRDQGERGLAAKLSAAGGVRSGAGQKALMQFGKNLDAGYRDNFIAQLANQQGVGLSGANALAGVGTNYANAISAGNANMANAIGNGALAKAGVNNNALSSFAGLLGQAAGGFGSSFGGRF